MVLTKAELIGSLQNEVRILLHLATKLDATSLDYRPTPKQRSSLELLRYLSLMGPQLVRAARTGTFDPAAWTAAQQQAETRDLNQTLDVIAAQVRPVHHADWRHDRCRVPRRDRNVRPEVDARLVHRQYSSLGVCGVSHAAVSLPQGQRARRLEHDEPVGRDGPDAKGVASRRHARRMSPVAAAV